MKITFVPTAGLCNRMNAVMCAFSLQEKVDSPEICWGKTPDCFAEFSELFEPLPPPLGKVRPEYLAQNLLYDNKKQTFRENEV